MVDAGIATMVASGIVGFLVGVLVTICVFATVRGARARRARRWQRKLERRAPAPMPQLWNPDPYGRSAARPVTDRPGGGINDYLDGRRIRPDFNQSPGPRDW
jgi:hypothetical protein